MPDFIFEEEAKKIFEMLGGQAAPAEEAEEVPEEPQEEIEEMSMVSGGGVAGYAGGVGIIRKRKRKRKRRMKETNYIKMKEALTHEEDILKEYLVEKYIAKLKPLMEDMSDPKFKLGVNLTSRAFNDIKKNYLEPFSELLVTDEEKMSYMVHILAKLGHVFIQSDVNKGIKNIALDKEFSDSLVSKGIFTPEIAREAEAAAATALEERDVQAAEEQISLEIDDEDVVAAQPEAGKEKETSIEAPETPIEDLDQTGNNLAGNTLVKIKAQLLDDYTLIGPEENNKAARQAFIEYTFKNLIVLTAGHWAGKSAMPEPLSSMYNSVTSGSDIVKEPEIPEEIPAEPDIEMSPTPAADESPIALEESDIQNIIKQSIIKTFRELNFS